MNIGTEQNGKHDIFERPVLILQTFSKETCRIIPLTSSLRDDRHHLSIYYNNEAGSLILSQTRSISTKRLSRKMCHLDKEQFVNVVEKLKKSIEVESPITMEGDGAFSEPEGMVR
jgi:mRNA-degrading endonuclease toxin of MazEF toxin-antitoxin module